MKNFNTEYTKIIKENKNKIYLIYSNKKKIINLSYGEFDKLVKNTILNLTKKKFKSKDNILIICENNWKSVVLIFACILKGLNISLIDKNESYSKISEFAKITNSKKIIKFNSRNKTKNIVQNTFNYDQFFEFNKFEKKNHLNIRNISKIFLRTSGTTGKSKAIQTNVQKLCNSSLNFSNFYKLNKENIILWNFYSLSYMGGFYNLMLIPFFSKNSVVIYKDNQYEFYFNFLSNINKFKINLLWITPTLLEFLIDKNNIKNYQIKKFISKVKYVFVGMGKSDFLSKNKFYKIFKIPIYDIYGLSEVPLFLGENKNNYKQRIKNSIGSLLPMNRIKLRKIGIKNNYELMVKSNFMLDGYLQRNKKIHRPFNKDGFFLTGDIVNKEGQLIKIKGRLKKIIKKNGILINLKEIENKIEKNKFIKEAFCIPISDKIYQENYNLKIELIDKEINQKEIKDIILKKIHLNPPNKIIFGQVKKNFSGKSLFNQ